jgi:predicted DNA-binding mobile mystery protein A
VNRQESAAGLRRRILREELDRAFERDPLLRIHLDAPRGGWLKTIRNALGMTAKQLGSRTGVAQSAISEAEAAEVEGRITLKTLRKMAEGLECDVVYALVPRGRLETMVHNQANRAARRIVSEVSHGMSLEAQTTDEQAHSEELDAARETLIAQGSRRIWDQEPV